jgi:hypothetical protein
MAGAEPVKRSEYEAMAEEFRAAMLAESEKPRDEQVWPNHTDEWLSVGGTATCDTPNCANYGVGFPVLLHENADGIYRVVCGECGASITPVLDLEDD